MGLKFRTFLALVGVVVCTGASLQLARGDTIRLGADYWYPYNGHPESDHPGYMVEIARAVFGASGHTLSYELIPWARAIQLANQGELDGLVGAAAGDVTGYLFPEEPLGRTVYIFFTRRESGWRYTGLKSLDEITLGYILSYSYAATLDRYIQSHPHSPHLEGLGGETALEQNIRKLRLGRIGALVSSPVVFYSTLEKEGIDPTLFREAGTAPELDPLYIAFSPKNAHAKEYAHILSDGVKKLRKSGELANILRRYNLKDWEK